MLRNIFKESPMIELYCLPSIRTNLLYSMSFGIILLLQVGQCLATPQTGSISVSFTKDRDIAYRDIIVE